jgi:hypothetical protein
MKDSKYVDDSGLNKVGGLSFDRSDEAEARCVRGFTIYVNAHLSAENKI